MDSFSCSKRGARYFKKSINSHQKSINFYEKKVQVGEENNVTLSRQKVAFDQLLLEEASLLRRYEITKLRLHYLTSNKLNSDIPKIAKLSEIKLLYCQKFSLQTL